MSIVKVTVDKASIARIMAKFGNVFDDQFKQYAHHRLAAYFDPYIPKETGTLSQSTNATPEYLEYWQPYAHYQWNGIVWGPNIPVYKNGVIDGWFSIPDRPKHPTDRFLRYSKEVNPNACSHWEERMMAERGKDFGADLERYAAMRFNGGGGP